MTPKQKRRLLLLIPVAISLVVVYFWPVQPCENVVGKFSQMQHDLTAMELIKKLDSLAYGGHCDTFSLVYDKTFWIVPKCGRSGAQFRDSLQLPGVSESIQTIMRQSKIGAIHYHYPNVSFELNSKIRGGFDFRLIFSRIALKEEDAFWSTCDDATKRNKERYHIFMAPHWYVAAIKLKSINRN